ncbi:hypothetical protein ACLOJK_022476 [Asimina triloba]
MELVFRPDDDAFGVNITYRCAVWMGFKGKSKWCSFRVYNSDKQFYQCIGPYGCRYLLMRDGIYYGVMQNERKLFTGGPYGKVVLWC